MAHAARTIQLRKSSQTPRQRSALAKQQSPGSEGCPDEVAQATKSDLPHFACDDLIEHSDTRSLSSHCDPVTQIVEQ